MNLLLSFLLALQSAVPAAAPPADEPLTLPAIAYPAEARAARITGSVQLEIAVDPVGHVTAVHALAGPIPLRQAAIEAYTRATYRPLLKDGRPTPALIHTSVDFSLRELPPDTDQQVDKEFQPLHLLCRQQSHDHLPEALSTCRQAFDLSHRFTPNAQLEARASAVNDIVLLQLDLKQYPEAASTANEAITLVAATSHPHSAAAATAYITRCEARSLAKEYPGAAADCAEAEETLNTLLADQSAPEESKSDRTANLRIQLRETLELHAIVLDKSHHPLEARHLRTRARSI